VLFTINKVEVMRLSALKRNFTFLILLFLNFNCALSTNYAVGVKNNTKEDTEGVKIDFYRGSNWEGRIMPGIIMPDSYKKQIHVDLPIPDMVTFHWRNNDDVQHTKDFQIKSILPSGFNGTIWFEISDSDNVNVILKEKTGP